MHRPAEVRGFTQTGQALIRFNCNAQRQHSRDGVVGVAIRFGSFDFDRDGPDDGDMHERNAFLRVIWRKSFVPTRLLIN